MRVRPKKALGQHFLTDMNVAARIADTIDVPAYASLPILEVGPGTGVLTTLLMAKHRPLKVVELDHESVEYLHTTYPDLDVVEGDFLKMPLDRIFPGQFTLTGNYPYNISSQIFFKLLDYHDRIPLCTGMLQKEVAERLCAPPGTKARGILSVLLQLWYDCEYLFTVHEHVFNPPPKVKSGVIRLTRTTRPAPDCDLPLLKTIVKTSFGQRRKTLRNSLSSLIPADHPLRTDPILAERPERLSTDQFIALTQALQPR